MQYSELHKEYDIVVLTYIIASCKTRNSVSSTCEMTLNPNLNFFGVGGCPTWNWKLAMENIDFVFEWDNLPTSWKWKTGYQIFGMDKQFTPYRHHPYTPHTENENMSWRV